MPGPQSMLKKITAHAWNWDVINAEVTGLEEQLIAWTVHSVVA